MTDQKQLAVPKRSFYNYKLFVLIAMALFVFCIGILANSYFTTGDIFKKGIELKGGVVVNLNLPSQIDFLKLQNSLSAKFPGISIREIRGVSGYEISMEASSDTDVKKLLEEVKAQGISTEKQSTRFVGASLGSAFYQQVQLGLVVSFILMAIVVFIMFRTFAPSTAVVLAASFDIIETIAFMNIFGIQLTLSSFAALLMLIGYSVDTDILLTSRVTKVSSDIPIPKRIKGAVKTGLTMTFTTIVALTVLLVSNISPVLSEIASVLLIGLVLDMVNTWITNVAIIRRYAEKKGL